MRIISKRTLVEETEYRREFEYHDEPGSGYSFECDGQGNLLNPDSTDRYNKCLDRADLFVDAGVVEYEHSYWLPASGVCDNCGGRVELEGFTNTCECGADYNMSGQRLAPRSQWGEETGESLSDILRIK